MNEVFANPVESTPTIPEERSSLDKQYSPMVSKVDVPVSRYSDVFNKSYTEKYFNVESTGATASNISEIERYVLGQIEERGLKDSPETYEKIIDEMFSKLGIDKDEEDSSKFFKAHTYINMLSKMELLKSLEESESLDNKISRLLERRR